MDSLGYAARGYRQRIEDPTEGEFPSLKVVNKAPSSIRLIQEATIFSISGHLRS